MKLKLNQKVKVKFWFNRLDGKVTKIKNGLYTIEADNKSFQFAENELEDKISIN